MTGKFFQTHLNDIGIGHTERGNDLENYPFTKAASECGFNNVAYFISVFCRRNSEKAHG